MVNGLLAVSFAQGLYWVAQQAYNIRLYAITEFGRVIHEFDPYFNYRATEVGRQNLPFVRCCLDSSHSLFFCF